MEGRGSGYEDGRIKQMDAENAQRVEAMSEEQRVWERLLFLCGLDRVWAKS